MSAVQESLSRPGPFGWLAAKLSRVTSSREYIPEVDGLRFLALIPVLLAHSTAHFLIERGWRTFAVDWTLGHGRIVRVFGMGWLGVPLFFVISGFVVSLPFARHALQGGPKPTLGRYFMRRVTRIEPPYFVALLAMYFIMGYRYYVPDLLAGLFYMHKVIFGIANPINLVTWSLEVEIMFYIIAPWLTTVFRIPGKALRWSVQIVLLCSYSYFVHFLLIPHGSHRLTDTILTALPFFQAGLLLADFYASGLMARSGRFLWDIAALGCSVWWLYAAAKNWSYYWLTPLMIMVIFIGGMEGRVFRWFLRLRPISLIGGMCYSAYLWHVAMLIGIRGFLCGLIPGLNGGKGALVFCLMALPILLIATIPLYLLLEKPFMNGPGSRYLEKVLRAMGGWFRRPVAEAPQEVA